MLGKKPKYKFENLILKLLFLAYLFLNLNSSNSREISFEGRFQSQKRDLTNWDKIDFEQWTNPGRWSLEWEIKASDTLWEIKQRELLHSEKFGMLLSCVGTCKIYRGLKAVNAEYQSQIKEGDEVQTWKDSYAYLIMIDGSLIRLPPLSSITLQEINIGVSKIFMMIRLNEGFVSYLSRNSNPLEKDNSPETDPLFLPLRLFEANYILPEEKKTEKMLANYLIESDKELKHREIVNKLIKENNSKFENKKTQTLFILPHANIFGTELSFHAYTQFGYPSYFKIIEGEAEISHRGYEHDEEQEIAPLKQWQKLDEEGKSHSPFEEGEELFAKVEFSTKRIPTIIHARELILKQQSPEIFSFHPLRTKIIQENDYQLWDSKEGSLDLITQFDLEARIRFIREYTKRLETSHLLASQILVKKKDIKEKLFSEDYYGLAYREYLNYISQGYNLSREKSPLFENYLENNWKAEK